MNLDQLISDLTRDEGLRLKPYRDTVGKFTIGIGRNLDDVGISKAEAHHLLENDIERVIQGLDGHLPWWRDLSEPRQRALANLCFQLGIGGLLKFKNTLAALKAGEWERAGELAKQSLWYRQTPQRADRVIELLVKG